ncbi:hypothetical protein [Cerasicoccus fimbriatus]|uniref:hypothetical protein n=1 Tax=Cerasicoccus fimbriatus TaxID=3014554 RepID=UPI0022B507AC|nr:hypothetical protein [Cerasicoccus sp. TK19100]
MLLATFRTVVLLILALSWSSLLDARTWTHQDGRTFEGDLIRVDDDSVVIERLSDGEIFHVRVAVLSTKDQNFIRMQEEGMSEATAKSLLIRTVAIWVGFSWLGLIVIFQIGRGFHFPNWGILKFIAWLFVSEFINFVLIGLVYLAVIYQKKGYEWNAYNTGVFIGESILHPATYLLGIFLLLIAGWPNSWFIGTTYWRAVLFLVCNWVIMWLTYLLSTTTILYTMRAMLDF